MKVTSKQLNQIIKEETRKVLLEAEGSRLDPASKNEIHAAWKGLKTLLFSGELGLINDLRRPPSMGSPGAYSGATPDEMSSRFGGVARAALHFSHALHRVREKYKGQESTQVNTPPSLGGDLFHIESMIDVAAGLAENIQNTGKVFVAYATQKRAGGKPEYPGGGVGEGFISQKFGYLISFMKMLDIDPEGHGGY